MKIRDVNAMLLRVSYVYAGIGFGLGLWGVLTSGKLLLGIAFFAVCAAILLTVFLIRKEDSEVEKWERENRKS